MLFKHTAQENKNNPRSLFRFNNTCLPIVVECLNSPWRRRVLCGCRRKAKRTGVVCFFFFVVVRFFFSLRDPLPNCGSLLPWWREAGREDAKLRPGGLTSAMLNSEGGAITRRKWKDSTNDTVAFERGGGGVVWGALDYDSQLYNLERPGDGSTMALAFWHLREAVPSFTSRHCCALRSLRSLTSMSSTSLKTTMEKKNQPKKTRLWLHCVVL